MKSFTEPTDAEKSAFLAGLRRLSPNAAVLSGCYKVPQAKMSPSFPSLPPTILSLYRPKYKELTPTELHDACKEVFETELSISSEESMFLFNSTVLQSQSLLWFEHRRGRLTASKFGPICHTSVDNPSKSLMKEIVHRRPIRTKAMKWGIDNEKTAIEAYVSYARVSHPSLKIVPSGLYVNPLSPHLGASPDAIVSCDCCSVGLLEVKCPYSCQHQLPTAAPYIEKGKLSRKHNYYYQIQGQISLFDYAYCDFVCWTPKGIYVERIAYDELFVTAMIPKLNSFFVKALLPSILCGTHEDDLNDSEADVYCLCRRGEAGKMIKCDSIQCEIGWYHYSCVNLPLDFEPNDNDEWFCSDCKQRQEHI